MYLLVSPEQFLRQARKFFKKHPDLKERFRTILQDLQQDPFQPHLALHSLSGKLSGLHAVSLTYSYRIPLTLLISRKEIILLDIGGHDEVYK